MNFGITWRKMSNRFSIETVGDFPFGGVWVWIPNLVQFVIKLIVWILKVFIKSRAYQLIKYRKIFFDFHHTVCVLLIVCFWFFLSSKCIMNTVVNDLRNLNPTNNNICQMRLSFSLAIAASCISVRSASWVAADNTDGNMDIIYVCFNWTSLWM